ncbi:defensin-like protein 194 [Capsella rubella]|uniref:defensin-like protein 194 n=1 Tax=Capsella rubella TaxID=81985 RepID=UPI000CD4C52D|nr:defensin-like protein 194 [Capsella rubella]
MSMAMKSVSTLANSEVSDQIGAQDSNPQCLREYSGAPLSYCTARIYPSLCYHRCRSEKSAKGGKCDGLKCFCDFCSGKTSAITF